MTDIVMTAAKKGLSAIDRTVSRVVLLLWLSALDRHLGSFGESGNPAE
jgi:hypothetical protein